jgi:diadenosine tetraphosphate (Ap4A) HIT family hydrolase
MPEFHLHERLLADCHAIGRMDHCHLLLHKNAVLPWFILVPETEVADLLDLSDDQLHAVTAEAAAMSRFIKHQLGWPKVNFAAIGNLVPQLHLHVIGRRPGDPCWPAPVWGHLEPSDAYSSDDIDRVKEQLRTAAILM